MIGQSAETPQRIEPALLETIPEPIVDAIAELRASTALLGRGLNPQTAASLAGLVRIMNTYYSNLIEGHNTRPREIEQALAGQFEADHERRDLQWEAASHVRVQQRVDRLAAEGALPDPVSLDFLRGLHREFYTGAPAEMLTVHGNGRNFLMVPGEWRSSPEQDVAVGRHIPPSSERVADFMAYFAGRYRHDRLGASARIIAMAAAHHRFNYIHPFPDGNGRVSRLMSHALGHAAGIGAHGLWSVSRGLARGLESRGDYKRLMDHADTPRRDDRDGRGNLSEAALSDFVLWFLQVSIDQVSFMAGLFDLDGLVQRFHRFVALRSTLKPQAAMLLEQLLIRGELDRGSVAPVTGLPERTARRLLADLMETGIVASPTPKGKLSLRFPIDLAEELFPRLFPET
jgi:Fic family protein